VVLDSHSHLSHPRKSRKRCFPMETQSRSRWDIATPPQALATAARKAQPRSQIESAAIILISRFALSGVGSAVMACHAQVGADVLVDSWRVSHRHEKFGIRIGGPDRADSTTVRL